MRYKYNERVEITKGFYKGRRGEIRDYERVPRWILKLFPNYSRNYRVAGYGWFNEKELKMG